VFEPGMLGLNQTTSATVIVVIIRWMKSVYVVLIIPIIYEQSSTPHHRYPIRETHQYTLCKSKISRCSLVKQRLGIVVEGSIHFTTKSRYSRHIGTTVRQMNSPLLTLWLHSVCWCQCWPCIFYTQDQIHHFQLFLCMIWGPLID
jgi:hypothetical protein